nr:hypothetical protein [uncultured Chryseobacterium sp.]
MISNIFLNAQKFSSTDFDKTLIEKNEVLRLAGDYNAVVALNKKYLKKAKEENYPDGEALCYINLANICGTIGNYKNEFHFLGFAESKISKTSNNALKAKLYQEYGQINFGVGLYKKALSCNSKSIYYIKQSNNEDRKIYRLERSYANRADFLYRINQPDSSLIYLHKALKERNEAPILKALIAKHHLLYTKCIDSAFNYLQQASKQLPADPKIKTVQRAVVYLNYGLYYFQTGEYQKALAYNQKALIAYKETNRAHIIPEIYLAIVNCYKNLNDPINESKYRELYNTAKENTENEQNEAINLSMDQILSDKDQEVNRYKHTILLYASELTAGFIILIVLIGAYILYKKRKTLLNKKSQWATEADTLKNKIKDAHFEELISLVKKNDLTFFIKFKQVYPEFIEQLLSINPTLSQVELTFCAMVKLSFTSKEIANYTFVQHKSVQQKKYRIRKKLNIPGDQDLFLFFNTLDIHQRG